ncbi:MAG: hypothetical protein AAF978_04765 [Cyanobacteria bacterium P01_E01_bin.48]
MNLNRYEIVKIATELGIHHAKIRDWAMGATVLLAHDEDKDAFEKTSLQAYRRMIYLIDKVDGYVADDCFGYWTIGLRGDRVVEFMVRWVEKDVDYLNSVKHDRAMPDCH